MIQSSRTSTKRSSGSDQSQSVSSQSRPLSKAQRNKESAREIDGIIDRWNQMSGKSSAARSMTSSMTVPMGNSDDSSATLSNDSYNKSSNFDDDNMVDITYVSKVSFIIYEKSRLLSCIKKYIRLKIHQKKSIKLKQL